MFYEVAHTIDDRTVRNKRNHDQPTYIADRVIVHKSNFLRFLNGRVSQIKFGSESKQGKGTCTAKEQLIRHRA